MNIWVPTLNISSDNSAIIIFETSLYSCVEKQNWGEVVPEDRTVRRPADRRRVEGAFSVIKRVFGEHVTATKLVNIAKEMMMVSIYNWLIKTMAQDRGDV